MYLNDLLKQKNMSRYRLAKESGVAQTTVTDICSGKAQLEKCKAETVYKIAKALDISMEELLKPCFLKRGSFENFKSAICHRVREMGDIDFIIDTLENDEIRKLYNFGWYPESLYLLAMLDYISRENDVPLAMEYDDLRRCKLEKPVYPSGLRIMSAALGNESMLKEAEKTAIPEFIHFNIVENEVRNVV